MTQHDAELRSEDMHKGKLQNKGLNALESHDNNHDLKVIGSRPSLDVTDIKYANKVDVNSIFEIAEHDDHVIADNDLHEVVSIKMYQSMEEVEAYSRKERSDSPVNRLEPNKEDGRSSVLLVQNRRKNTSLDHSDEAFSSGCLENMLEREVITGHGTILKVGEDILVENPLGGSSDFGCASGDRKNRSEVEESKETIDEDSFAKDMTVADLSGEEFEQAKRAKLKLNPDAVCHVYSAEEKLEESTRFCKEHNASDDASGCDPPSDPLDQKRQCKIKDAVPSLMELDAMKDNITQVINTENSPTHMVLSSQGGAHTGCLRRKLLVLDVNGLLADIVPYIPDGYKADTIIGRKAVFKRPFCDDFLQFCFERYNVGVWSSRRKRNVQLVLDFLMGETSQNLLFCWDQSHCTETGFNTVENKDKPLVLKELKKLWEKHEPNLPWEKGEYNESNTLLLDDSPYKALRNPPYTAIFPPSYQYKDEKDNSLGPGGDLRVYLEGLALAENVQKYVEQNPYGQRSITNTNLSWSFYLKVIGTTSSQLEGDSNNSELEHASEQNEMRSEMEKSEETINEDRCANYMSLAYPAGGNFEQAKRARLKEDKPSGDASGRDPTPPLSELDELENNVAKRARLNINQDAVCDVYSVEQQLEESTRFCKEGKLSGDTSGWKPTPSLSKLDELKDNITQVVNKENHPPQMLKSSLGRTLTGCFSRKLLVLDVIGLLADTVSYVPDGYVADAIIGEKAVFKRPFCDDFLQFCFERFSVGVWSSQTRRNVRLVLDFLLGKNRHNLLFFWDRYHCTQTGFNTVENREKPLVLKELKRLWEKYERNLPWERGEYNELNTLLLDNYPHKALRNPPNTAIFPNEYRYRHEKDNSLGPRGDLRVYLEGLALAENVQKYVEQHPFGQRPITNKNLSWNFYLKVIGTTSSQQDDANNSSDNSSLLENDVNSGLHRMTREYSWKPTFVRNR